MTRYSQSPLHTDLKDMMRRNGHAFNPEVLQQSLNLYRPIQERAPKDGVKRISDLTYGKEDSQLLDIFTPETAGGSPMPVVVYFHGGGFIAGARSPLPGLIYDNVPTFFARNGVIGVNATYRLAPEHKWPTGGQDVGAAIAWLKTNIADYGGDPSRMFAIGQSAGGTHVASYAFMSEVHGDTGPGVAGAILLSGTFAPLDPDYGDGTVPENFKAYFGDDTENWASRSPLYHVKPGHPPIMISVAEYDPYALAWPSMVLAATLTKCDRITPRFKYLPDHNHVTPAMHINSEYDILGPEILAFINSIA